MPLDNLLERILDPAARPNPYPLWAELRDTRVATQDNGSFIVGGYHDILALLHDPRISSDKRNRGDGEPDDDEVRQFISCDAPEHDRLRRMINRAFGPPHCPNRIDSMRGELAATASSLADRLQGKSRVDIVDDFAYPLPVTMICRILGVPHEDEPRFHVWADELVAAIDPTGQTHAGDAKLEMLEYLGGLIEERRANPRDDMLSELAHDNGPDGRLTAAELGINAIMLFIAGHETTVNLIANGTLTLLRNPDVLERLRQEPDLMPNAIEELLRFEPPVHMLAQRTPLDDIEVGDVTIPKGSQLILAIAAGNRDPLRFDDPERFIPDRRDIQHLGLGSGIHSCFGAPLARLEGQMALTELISRLPNPRLVEDPPPYRPNPVLRGPRHLLVECG